MKTGIVALAFTIAVPALAALSLEGAFDRTHDVAFLGYEDAQTCKADGGRWEEAGSICFFEADDSVVVTNDSEGLKVGVSTISTNGRTCDFSGKAKQISDTEIVASVATSKYEASNDSYVDAVCELKVTYTSADSVNVTMLSERSACEELCGASTSLEIEGALRRK